MIHEVLAGEVDILVDLISSYLSNGINNGDVSLENNAGTLTVYVFGFDVNGQVKAYKMKSGNNFRSELIAGGEIGPKEIIKPNNSEIVSAIRPILSIENTEEQLKKIMRIQKSIEDASGVSNKEYVGIGGENYCLQFNRNSEMAAIKRIDTFDDYEEQYEYAYDHINDN
ncbi:hypothetical protein FD31_GL002671 [Companilactobacillus nantensis DSM 16982]|uniref:Uncharacterized protein n=2 Tax=Lactobacillaceae TaxID=33958 RepID=A0A0R1WI23_9LACO|nr:hypothetical protein FD31_GL002671 [Companilactobacillus nantensis DSM 16982]